MHEDKISSTYDTVGHTKKHGGPPATSEVGQRNEPEVVIEPVRLALAELFRRVSVGLAVERPAGSFLIKDRAIRHVELPDLLKRERVRRRASELKPKASMRPSPRQWCSCSLKRPSHR